MKRIIYGAYGYNNLGDEAILSSLISKFNEDKLIIFSGNPHQTKKYYGYKSTKPSIKEIIKCDTIVIGGGGIFFDKIIKYFLTVGLIGIIFKKDIEVLGVGVTPLNNFINRFFLRYVLSYANKISVRDDFSKKLLIQYGIKKEIKVVSDLAFSLKEKKLSGELIKKLKLTNKKKIFVSAKYILKSNKTTLNINKSILFQKNLALILDKQINLGRDVFFMPFCTSSSKVENDLIFAKELNHFMKNKLKIINIKNPSIMKGLLKKADLLIGMRFHSLILGNNLESNKIISLSYDPKIKSYAEKNNITCLDIGDLKFKNLENEINHKLG
ncbi:hypothetical protein HON03_02230 [archaeon]|jgi:polysaccharide pyruvyl transferase CsaB|nr:hypothetical protein [archaeon]MBT7296261.1 hypothetical protein [Candidatus Woesearchaeota archaeon]